MELIYEAQIGNINLLMSERVFAKVMLQTKKLLRDFLVICFRSV